MYGVTMPRARRKLPTQERLLELLSYNPKTGEIHWKQWRGGPPSSDGQAGTIRKNPKKGYKVYRTICVDMVIYAAHRLIWKMMLGTEPPDTLDHHDADTLNDRWVNLRPADDQTNAANRVHTSSSGGYKGVYRSGKKFTASIKVNQKPFYLGTFTTAEEAHAAYAEAARKHFGAYHRTH